MKNSKFLNLNTFDFIKGFLVAVLTSVITALLQMISLVPPIIDWKTISVIALSSALAYLLKQLATNSKGAIMQKEGYNVEDIGGGTAGTPKP